MSWFAIAVLASALPMFAQSGVRPKPAVMTNAAKPDVAKPETAPKPQSLPAEETLRYDVNWPSGLNLGEATITNSLADRWWGHTLSINAAIPGYGLSENAKSRATNEGCSVELVKEAERGKRKVAETTRFDAATKKATRETKGGGKSELTTSSCARDALAFLSFVRREVASGRLPQSQSVYYGAPYQVSMKFAGTESIRMGNKMEEVDRLALKIKGPGSELSAELFLSRDAARLPLRMQVQLPLSKLTMELVR